MLPSLLLWAGGSVASAATEEFWDCGTEEVAEDPEAFGLPTEGYRRALFIFARFPDDNIADWADHWPIDTTATQWDSLPSWASDLAEDTGGPPGSAPVEEGSLAHYFWLMSRGDLLIDVSVYGQVVVLDSTISEYRAVGTGTSRVDRIARDALARVAADSTFSFTPFINTGSGKLDYVCVVFRSLSKYEGTCEAGGVVSIASTTGHGVWEFAGSVWSAADQQQVYWNSAAAGWVTSLRHRICSSDYSSYVSAGAFPEDCHMVSGCATQPVAPCSAGGSSDETSVVLDTSLNWYRTVIAHEMMHSVFLGEPNLSGGLHMANPVVWGLMTESDHGTLLHGYERLSAGWVEPIDVQYNEWRTIRLYDSFARNVGSWGASDSTYCRVFPVAQDTTQYFLIENRRASTPYAEGWAESPVETNPGQPGSGLLITHVNYGSPLAGGDGCGDGNAFRLNVESAYGLFDENFDPDPVGGHNALTGGRRASAEDPFLPGRNNTFAPYTCPNTNLYAWGDTLQSVSSGLAILNIRTGPDSSLIFDIRWNQPQNATGAGSVTWNGQVLLADDFSIQSGHSVALAENARVLAGPPRTADQGVDKNRVEVLVADGGTLDFGTSTQPPFLGSARDTAQRIGPKPDGTLYFTCDPNKSCALGGPDSTEIVAVAPGPADWYGLRVKDVEDLDIGEVVIDRARAAVALEADEFPDAESLFGMHKIVSGGSFNDLSFDRDVQIGPSDSVVVPPGLRVGFAANRDVAHNNGLGTYPNLSELLVNGPTRFEGTEAKPIVLRSDDPDSSGAGLTDDWGGMKLFPEAPSGGYCDCERTLEFTQIRDAVRAIAVLDTCLMTLTKPSFENNSEGDIYLDRDVRIAEGQSVTLQGPMRVVATTTSQYDHGDGESGKVDIVQSGGRFQTYGDGAGGDRVVFESTTKDSANGDDWGSIVVSGPAVAILEDADIGFAVRPLNLVAADTAEVRRCYLHNYNEEAILDWYGSVIEDNVIETGPGFDTDLATTGIHCIAGEPVISGNEIGQQRLYGIRWHGSESFCNASVSQTPTKTVTIVGNTLTGEGEEVGIAGSAGIFLEWFCQYYQGAIQDNLVTQWSGRGMHIYQAADVDLGCNRFIDNRVGLRYERVGGKMKSYEGSVWFTRNEMRSSRTWNVALDDNVGMRWYDRAGGGSSAESNAMELEQFVPYNVDLRMTYFVDADFGATSWKIGGSIVTDSTTIRATFNGGLGDVLLSPILASEDLCSAGASRGRGGESMRAPDGQGEDQPIAWSIRPAPAGVGVPSGTVELSVPGASQQSVQVAVYDVRGRRVVGLGAHALEPGRYRFTWDRRDTLGRPVAAGVYFVRVTAPDFSGAAKLVVVR